MSKRAPDLLVLIDGSDQPREAIENLTFVPPLPIRRLPEPPDPNGGRQEPLLYLLGRTKSLRTTASVIGWLDGLAAAGGAPVAFLVPRAGLGCFPAATHPHCCGLIPCRARISVDALEQALHHARRSRARIRSRRTVRQARIRWSFSTQEAADSERTWLGIEAALTALTGADHDLSRLGMAFAEALTNAVEHGNLELESSLKDVSDDGLLRFFTERERRLRHRRYGRRRLEVTAELRSASIRIAIRHQGAGFDPSVAARRRPAGSAGSLHGMGLRMIEGLIRGYTISPDGRTVTLHHELSGGWRRPPVLVPDENPQADPMRPAA